MVVGKDAVDAGLSGVTREGQRVFTAVTKRRQ
jgi:hypothetical protein